MSDRRPTPTPEPERTTASAAQGHDLSRRGLLASVLAARSSAGLTEATDVPLGPQTRAIEPSPVGPAAFADAELLRQCDLVQRLEAEAGSDDRWSPALRQVADLRPTTLAGLRAKTELALLTLPFGSARSCPDWASPDERLVWSLLRDLLALSDPDRS